MPHTFTQYVCVCVCVCVGVCVCVYRFLSTNSLISHIFFHICRLVPSPNCGPFRYVNSKLLLCDMFVCKGVEDGGM